MKCNICQVEVGKKGRECVLHNQKQICRRCCAEVRDWCKCPITCRFFKIRQNSPKAFFKEFKLEEVNSGDIIQSCDYLFLPNLYDCVTFDLLKIELSYEDIQTMDINLEFKLKKEFTTKTSEILCKDQWKSNFYPFGLEESNLHPIIGISSLKKGLFSLNEGEIELKPLQNFFPSVSHWIISSPNQRPIIPTTNINQDVNFIFARNLMFFGELLFDVPYTLKMRIYGSNNSLFNEDTLNTRFGLIIPFSKVNIIKPSFYEAPDTEILDSGVKIFSPAKASVYPGENPRKDGVSFLGIRDNSGKFTGSFLKNAAGENVFGKMGPFYCRWDIKTKPEKELMASVLLNDRVVNPTLLPTLLNWVGDISCPLHVYLINFSQKSHRIVIRCTEQTVGNSWDETITLRRKSDAIVPMNLVGIRNGSPGTASILVEVLENQTMIYSDVVELEVLPDDHLLLRIHDVGRDWYRNTVKAVACWVTPHEPEIDQWITDSRAYIAGGQFFGNQGDPEPQVAALWQELENRGLSYVDRSFSIGDNDRIQYQRVTKPHNTLGLSSGNCIDLTVLFASALEQLSLEPIIFIIPGHAFVGWEIPGYKPGFLETTLIGNSNFDVALRKGEDNFKLYEKDFNQDPRCKIIKLSDLRKQNLLPIR